MATDMDFGQVLKELRKGNHLRRKDWAKNSFIKEFFWNFNDDDTIILPCLMFKAAEGWFEMGWTPSYLDMFNVDWEIVT